MLRFGLSPPDLLATMGEIEWELWFCRKLKAFLNLVAKENEGIDEVVFKELELELGSVISGIDKSLAIDLDEFGRFGGTGELLISRGSLGTSSLPNKA